MASCSTRANRAHHGPQQRSPAPAMLADQPSRRVQRHLLNQIPQARLHARGDRVQTPQESRASGHRQRHRQPGSVLPRRLGHRHRGVNDAWASARTDSISSGSIRWPRNLI